MLGDGWWVKFEKYLNDKLSFFNNTTTLDYQATKKGGLVINQGSLTSMKSTMQCFIGHPETRRDVIRAGGSLRYPRPWKGRIYLIIDRVSPTSQVVVFRIFFHQLCGCGVFKGTVPSLKLTVTNSESPWKWAETQKERMVSQSSIFRGELLVSGMVVYPCPSYYLQGTVKCTSKRWFFGIPEPSTVWFYSGHWMDITQFLLGPITRFLHIQKIWISKMICIKFILKKCILNQHCLYYIHLQPMAIYVVPNGFGILCEQYRTFTCRNVKKHLNF